MTLIQVRGGTAAQWATANPTLAAREWGVEIDTHKAKIGDGSTIWASLPYVGGAGGAVDSVNGATGVVVLDATDVGADVAGAATAVANALTAHINDATDAHAASAITFTPNGSIAATTVQAAIVEVRDEAGGATPDASTTMKGLAKLATAPVSAGNPIAVGDNDPRNSDARTPTDASVTLAKLAAAVKPSGSAASGDEAVRALGATASTACAGNDARLSDTRTPTDGSVTLAKVSSTLKPSGSAATTDESLRALGTTASTAAAGNHAHAASAVTFTPDGSIAATTVQAAIVEVRDEAASGTTPDADASTKGKLQLAGDLGGTAALPTVPGLAAKAPLASPTLTGTPIAPTAAPGANTTQLATTAFATAAIAVHVGSADPHGDRAYADTLIAANDALIYKGAIDASANPNYPAASAGHLYKISVAGKIGGVSGPNVEVGDSILCTVDGSAAGTQAAVGANWSIIQTNIDGAVIGPASSVASRLASFSGTSGKLIQDAGVVVSIDGTLAGNSDTNLPTEKAVKTYVTAHGGGGASIIDGGSMGASPALNAAGAPFTQYTGTLTAASAALTVSGVPAGGWAALELVQDATGGRLLTVNGVSVPLDGAANAVNAVLLFTPNGSTFYITGQKGATGATGAAGATGATGAAGANGTNGAISVIEDEGSALTVRSNVNFVGAGVTATDQGGKTVVTIPGGAGTSALLTPTAVKTGAYTAAAGDLVLVDTTSGNVTITAPAATAGSAPWGVKHIIRGGTNTVTIQAAGSDVFNKTGGSTSLTLTLVNQSVRFSPQAGVHVVDAGDLTLSGLDARYQAAGGGTSERGAWVPSDNALITAAPSDPQFVTGATVLPTNGLMQVTKLWVPTSVTIANLCLIRDTAGSSLTSGQNFGMLYSSAGVLLAKTADLTTAWGVAVSAAAIEQYALTAEAGQSLTLGGSGVFVFAAIYSNGTTRPTFRRGSSNSNGAYNFGLTAANYRAATSGASTYTTTPPSTLPTLVSATQFIFWMGLT